MGDSSAQHSRQSHSRNSMPVGHQEFDQVNQSAKNRVPLGHHHLGLSKLFIELVPLRHSELGEYIQSSKRQLEFVPRGHIQTWTNDTKSI